MGAQVMWGISKDRVTSADTQASQKNALGASGITLCPGSLRGSFQSTVSEELTGPGSQEGAGGGLGWRGEQMGGQGGGGSWWGGCEAVGHEGSHIMGTS